MDTEVIAAAALACLMALPAAAQTTSMRTFVSGVGSDTGTCQRAAPCRSFQYAYNNTPAGGEVIALDPGGYGTLTITQAISIIGPPSGYASITAPPGGTGVAINAAGAAVSLRGIEIDGGSFGINATAVGTLDINDVVVKDASTVGIYLRAAGEAASVHDSMVTGGQSSNVGVAVEAGSANIARVTVTNTSLAGVVINGQSSSVTLVDSTLSGAGRGVFVELGTIFIKGSVIVNSQTQGVANLDTMRLDSTTVFGSGQIDVFAPGGNTSSFGNNNFGKTSGTITKVTPN